jgi:hypothetical protein
MPRAKEHDASSQLVTFQRWWNSYLEPRGLPVTDLLSQIGDGYLGFRLLEALEGLPAAPVQRGKAKIMGVSVVAKPAVLMQKMDNLNNLLEVLMTTKGVKVRAAHGARIVYIYIPARHPPTREGSWFRRRAVLGCSASGPASSTLRSPLPVAPLDLCPRLVLGLLRAIIPLCY